MHKKYMRQALASAKSQQGFCSPNPAVGAVVVQNDHIIASGTHHGPGTWHAEKDALDKLSLPLDNASIYVTLEPCCTHGRTPPCTELLIKSGIKKVFFGYLDPNPNVQGKGIEALVNHNIECEHLPLPEIDEFYKAYQHWHQTQHPWVTAKLALSLDGKISHNDASTTKLTSQEVDQFTHQQRKQACAILTTAKTITVDNPQLNARVDGNILAKPLYILDRHLTLPFDAKVINTAASITIFYDKDSPRAALTQQLTERKIGHTAISCKNGQLNWQEIIEHIGHDGIHHLWVEAGGKCFSSLAESGHLNTALLYYCPKVLGPDAYPGLQQAELFSQKKRIHWQIIADTAVCEVSF